MSIDFKPSSTESIDPAPHPLDDPELARRVATEREIPKRIQRRLAHKKLAKRKKQPIKKDFWWGFGLVWFILSLLVLSFAFHAAVFSNFQFQAHQSQSQAQLRNELARATTPTGALDFNGDLVEDGHPVALLEIPVLGIRVSVEQGTTANVLRGAVGHRRDTVMPGQPGTSVLLGRQFTYGGIFKNLKRLKPGDQISIVTGQGTHVYRVFGLRRAGDPLPAPLDFGRGRLELRTGDGPSMLPDGVLHVDADLVSDVYEAPGKVLTYPALPMYERAMGKENSTWPVAVLWALLFAGAAAGIWWLRGKWGPRQAWVVGVPTLVFLGASTADAIMNALPNLI